MLSQILKFLIPVFLIILLFFGGYKVWTNFNSSSEPENQTTEDSSDNSVSADLESSSEEPIPEVPNNEANVPDASGFGETSTEEIKEILSPKDKKNSDVIVTEPDFSKESPVALSPQEVPSSPESERVPDSLLQDEGFIKVEETVIRSAEYEENTQDERPSEDFTVKMVMAGKTYWLEHAKTQEKRAKGLMNRDYMPPNQGMIFSFPKEEYYSFWMKNTLIPLDIIWLDSDFVIVDQTTLQPCPAGGKCPSYKPKGTAIYAVEINAGLFDSKIGETLDIEFLEGA